MMDLGSLVNSFGWPGAMLILLITVLILAFRKINQLGTPFVISQIEYTKTIQASSESQARSLASLAVSFESIEKATAAQNVSNRLVAAGLSQLIDSSKGVSKEHVETIEFNLRKLEEQVLRQDATLGIKSDPKAEQFQNPKLKMEPLVESAPRDLAADVEEIKQEITPEDNP